MLGKNQMAGVQTRQAIWLVCKPDKSCLQTKNVFEYWSANQRNKEMADVQTRQAKWLVCKPDKSCLQTKNVLSTGLQIKEIKKAGLQTKVLV